MHFKKKREEKSTAQIAIVYAFFCSYWELSFFFVVVYAHCAMCGAEDSRARYSLLFVPLIFCTALPHHIGGRRRPSKQFGFSTAHRYVSCSWICISKLFCAYFALWSIWCTSNVHACRFVFHRIGYGYEKQFQLLLISNQLMQRKTQQHATNHSREENKDLRASQWMNASILYLLAISMLGNFSFGINLALFFYARILTLTSNPNTPVLVCSANSVAFMIDLCEVN